MNNEYPKLMAGEFNAIKKMLEASEKQGLQTEVVHHFAQCLREGDNILEAVRTALYEWDI